MSGTMDDQMTLRPCSCGGIPGVLINISGTQVHIRCPECGTKIVLTGGKDKEEHMITAPDIVGAMRHWNSEPETFSHGLSFWQPKTGMHF